MRFTQAASLSGKLVGPPRARPRLGFTEFRSSESLSAAAQAGGTELMHRRMIITENLNRAAAGTVTHTRPIHSLTPPFFFKLACQHERQIQVEFTNF